MAEYAWKALTTEGAWQMGRSHASDLAQLTLELKRSGLILVKAKPVRQRWRMAQTKVSSQILFTFSFQLGMMLRAGVTLLEALQDMAQTEGHSGMRQVMNQLVDRLMSGKTLSQAMLDHPLVFDAVYVHLVQAGEQTGQLTEVLENLTETLKWQHEMAAQTRRVLMYPAIVLLVITGVLVFLMTYVVPRVAELLLTLQIPLPWPTRVLIFISDSLRQYGVWLGLALLGGVIFGRYATQSTWLSRYSMDRCKLQLPVIGSVLRQIALARFAYVFALLYAAGVTVMDALKIVENAIGNQVMAALIANARQQIAQGKNLSTAFSGSDLFPPAVISMLRVGEATGSLDKALHNVSYLYSRSAKEAVAQLQTSLQPIMTLVLGGILALIMVFTLGPLYESVVAGGRF